MNQDERVRTQPPLAAREDSRDSPRQPSGDVPTLILPSILLACCCCFPLGVVALANGLKVKSHLAQGEYDAAMEASAQARRQLKIGFITGIAAAFVVMMIELLLSVG